MRPVIPKQDGMRLACRLAILCCWDTPVWGDFGDKGILSEVDFKKADLVGGALNWWIGF